MVTAVDGQGRKRWWAAIGLGAFACASCCLVAPLLAAIGLAGTGALLTAAHWLQPVGYALIAVGLGGLVVTQGRSYRRRSAGIGCSDSEAAECSCAQEPATESR